MKEVTDDSFWEKNKKYFQNSDKKTYNPSFLEFFQWNHDDSKVLYVQKWVKERLSYGIHSIRKFWGFQIFGFKSIEWFLFLFQKKLPVHKNHEYSEGYELV